VQALHGLSSCSEWTGVKLSTLLEETGVDPKAKWFIAEGADAPHLTRSVPMMKAFDLRAVHQPHRYIAVRAVGAPARPCGRGREESADITLDQVERPA
jgi:DMSO/TMAO reductase YedYZ molybdopterin-dependent catalytic subunit